MEILDSFSAWKHIDSLPAGAVIYREREPADAVFVILEGDVELSKYGELLTTEHEGGIIGELAMIEDCYRSATATATSAVRLARINREDLADLIGRNAVFSIRLMEALAERLRLVDNLVSERFAAPAGSS